MAKSAMRITHELAVPTSTFHFVRHGATEPNLCGLRCGGDLDLPMTETGREQARASAQQILDKGIGVIVCSQLRRTREHAGIVSGILGGTPIVIEPLLNERCMGEWNLRSVTATEAFLARGVAPPGGESEQAFVARVSTALERFQTLLPLNPLIISSKAVARVFNILLGGSGRLTLDNGEMIRFTMKALESPISNERIPK